MKIKDWRTEIDVIDDELVILLNRRATLVAEIAAQKRQEGLAFRDAQRECQVLFRARRSNLGPMDGRAIDEIFGRIISESRRVSMEIAKASAGEREVELDFDLDNLERDRRTLESLNQ